MRHHLPHRLRRKRRCGRTAWAPQRATGKLLRGEQAFFYGEHLQRRKPVFIVGRRKIVHRVHPLDGVPERVERIDPSEGEHRHAEDTPFPRRVKARFIFLPHHPSVTRHPSHVVDAVHSLLPLLSRGKVTAPLQNDPLMCTVKA